MDDHALIDAGDGDRLERFGPYVVARPAPGALEPRRRPDVWTQTDLRFDRADGWSGPALAAAASGWTIRLGGVGLRLRPTDAGQLGCFPEHAAMLPWLRASVAERRSGDPDGDPPSILHGFASTGLVTLALAGAGAAVTHVDAARPAVAWARENAELNDLAEARIRWIVDDVAGYAAREVRRGRRYDGVVLDPPSYGHGAGRAWRIERDLPPLLETVTDLVVDDGFVLVTAHTTGLEATDLGDLLRPMGASVQTGDLVLHGEAGARLPLGGYARVERAGGA